ncbi:MAG: outer membrane protein transport protein [Pseudomonadota bacterium]
MNKSMSHKIIAGAVLTSALLSGQVMATNGYLAHGYGPAAKSMAGACVAMVESAMCAAHNPATLVHLDDRWEVGAALFSPDRGFQANADFMSPPFASVPPGEYSSSNDFFLIPHIAYSRNLDENTNLGFIFGGQGGMNTEYNSAVWRNFTPPGAPPMFQGSSPTGVDLIQAFLGVSYGRKLNDRHAVAVMPVIAIQRFEAYGLEPFRGISIAPDKVTNNGYDWSWGGGLRVGWLWQATDDLNIGASYQTRLWMTDFDDYAGLFAEGGGFDMPPVLDLGFAYDFNADWTLSVNYQHIWFEEIDTLGNPADLLMVPGVPVLGTDDGLGFGWKDQDVIKVGLRWKYSPDLTLRAGYSHGTEVVPGNQALFNVLAPAVVQDHFTLGFSKKLNSDSDFHLSFMYAPEKKVHGQNPNTGPQTGHLYMSQWEVEVGWKF